MSTIQAFAHITENATSLLQAEVELDRLFLEGCIDEEQEFQLEVELEDWYDR
jgi:hypothetical protein